MAHLTDTQAMGLALDKARKGVRGANPLVGAVIVDATGQLLATGWHRGAGSPHAEADALANARKAGIDVRGARMYVTLEPCNHTGRTGPCSVAIAKAGIAEVVYAYADTTEDAAGGATYLRSQGITVRGGQSAHEIGQDFAALGLANADILSSDQVRAVQTASSMFDRAPVEQNWLYKCEGSMLSQALQHKVAHRNLILVTHSECIEDLEHSVSVNDPATPDYASTLFVLSEKDQAPRLLGYLDADQWPLNVNAR